MPADSDWNAMRWGFKFQIAGVLFFALGIVVALPCLYYVASTWPRGPLSREQTVLLWVAGIAGIISAGGALLRLVGLLKLASNPAVPGAGGWASWGLRFLPAGIGMVVLLTFFNEELGTPDPFMPPFSWVMGALSAALLFDETLCFSHLLRSAAKFWGRVTLRRQFQIWFIVFWSFNIAWVGIMLCEGYGPFALKLWIESTFHGEVGFYSVPVILLGLMIWHLVLLCRLLGAVSPSGSKA